MSERRGEAMKKVMKEELKKRKKIINGNNDNLER